MTSVQTSVQTSFQTSNREYPTDYYYHRDNFLEEVDYLREGPPSWVFDYYLEGHDLYQRYYNQWQNQVPGLTDGVRQDGDQHLEEYQQHLERSETPHCQLVTQCESYPWQEPHQRGPPIHCSYTQVKVPYGLLPQEVAPGCEMIPGTSQGPWVGQHDLVPMIIGRRGDFMNQLTQECGLHYIWYNKNPLGYEDAIPEQDGCFELWGREELLSNAVVRLNQHIQDMVDQIWSRDIEAHAKEQEREEAESYQHNSHSDSDSDYGTPDQPEQPIARYDLPIDQYVANWPDEVLQDIIVRERDIDEPKKAVEITRLTHEEMLEIIANELFSDIAHDRMAIFTILDGYRRSYYYGSDSSDADSVS